MARSKTIFTCMLFGICSFSSVTIAQDAPHQPSAPIIVDVEKIGDLPIPLIMVPRKSGKFIVNSGEITKNGIIASIPFDYRRTGILKSDIIAKPIFKEKTYLKAGAVGYWAGRFTSQIVTTRNYSGSSYGPKTMTEIWCFFGKDGKDRDAYICIQDGETSTNVLSTNRKPYMLTEFSSSINEPELDRPKIEEKQLDVAPDLAIEYRFDKFKKNYAVINEYINDELVKTDTLPLETDGSAILITPLGTIKIVKSKDENANISLISGPEVSKKNDGNKIDDAEIIRLLDFEITKEEKRAADFEKASPNTYNFLTKPDFQTVPKHIDRNSLIFEQTLLPSKAYTQVFAPQDRGRFGEAGALLFPHVNSSTGETILCWRDYKELTDRFDPNLISFVNNHCIGDEDKDGKYEILWKDIQFVQGSIYGFYSKTTRTVLDGEGNKGPVIVKPANINDMMVEKIGLFYMGPSGEELDENGKIKSTKVDFEWRYLTLRHNNSRIENSIYKYSISINDKGEAIKIDENGNEVVKVTNIQSDGSADIIYNKAYPLGEHALINYKEYAANIRKKVEDLKQVSKVLKAKSSNNKDINANKNDSKKEEDDGNTKINTKF